MEVGYEVRKRKTFCLSLSLSLIRLMYLFGREMKAELKENISFDKRIYFQDANFFD